LGFEFKGNAMAALTSMGLDAMWRVSFVAIPLALIVAGVCRWGRCRPCTRHVLWLSVLVWFVAGPFLPSVDRRDWLVGSGSVSGDGAGVGRHESPADGGLARAAVERRQNPESRAWAGAGSDRIVSENVSERDGIEGLGGWDGLGVWESGGIGDWRVVDSPKVDGLASVQVQPLGDALATYVEANGGPGRGQDRAEVLGRAAKQGADESGELVSAWGLDGQTAFKAPGSVTVIDWRGLTEAAFGRVAVLCGWLAIGGDAWFGLVVDLPPVARAVWLAGSAVFALLMLVTLVRARRFMRSAEPADESVRSEVRRAATELGLRRVPVTRMDGRAVSPMVWCGWTPVLVLPRSLWSLLGRSERRAVLVHELAHLMRRDHWVRRLSLVVRCLYWWNPLAWWVIRRLDDEADSCCDRWVAWVWPEHRRDYASALILAQRWVGRSRVPAGALAMGVQSKRGRWLAHRITEIMLDGRAPGRGWQAWVVAAGVALMGWLVLPSGPGSAGAALAADVERDNAAGVHVLAVSEGHGASQLRSVDGERDVARVAPGAEDIKPDEWFQRIARLGRAIEGLNSTIQLISDEPRSAALSTGLGSPDDLVSDAPQPRRWFDSDSFGVAILDGSQAVLVGGSALTEEGLMRVEDAAGVLEEDASFLLGRAKVVGEMATEVMTQADVLADSIDSFLATEVFYQAKAAGLSGLPDQTAGVATTRLAERVDRLRQRVEVTRRRAWRLGTEARVLVARASVKSIQAESLRLQVDFLRARISGGRSYETAAASSQ